MKATSIFTTALAVALLSTAALAQNVVNGVDRDSPAYRTAYLNTANPGVCDVNLSQDNHLNAGRTYADPLFRRNREQWQACVDASSSGGARTGSFGGPGGSAI